MTASDLIHRAARIAGILATGEVFSGQDASDALSSLKGIFETWNNEGFFQWKDLFYDFPLTAATMGAGYFSIDKTSPLISNATIIVSSQGANLETPLMILNKDQYAAIPDKSITSTRPYKVYIYNALEANDDNLSIARGYLYPIPSVDCTLRLYIKDGLTLPANLIETLSIPQAYSRALIYEMAIELGENYGRELAPSIFAKLDNLKSGIKRRNIQIPTMSSELANTNGRLRNIYTGEQ